MIVGVVGATGVVGRQLLRELEPLTDLQVIAIASPRSKGQFLDFRGKALPVNPWTRELTAKCDYVLMSAGSEFSRQHSPEIAELGAIVIDNSSAWRREPGVPLVVPEVNAADLRGFRRGVIANPNCSTIQMVVSLEPLRRAFGLKTVVVSTYQSVSGAGRAAMEALRSESSEHIRGSRPTAETCSGIAYNVHPGIGGADLFGYCEEEGKMIRESRRILGLPDLTVLPSTVRVPVYVGHAEAITVELSRSVSLDEVLSEFRSTAGLEVGQDSDLPVTPRDYEGKAAVSVSRVRCGFGAERSPWVAFWNVADNLRKGAAVNAVGILETLLRDRSSAVASS